MKIFEKNNSKLSISYIDSLNFYFILAIMISIHVTYVAFYAVIAY